MIVEVSSRGLYSRLANEGTGRPHAPESKNHQRLHQGVNDMNSLILLANETGSTANLSIFDPSSPAAHAIRSLFILVLAVCGVILAVVEGVLIYSIVRFRHRGAIKSEPPQVYGSKPIEIAWTAAPALIVFVLA